MDWACKKCGYSGWVSGWKSPKVAYLPISKRMHIHCRKCGADYFNDPLDITAQPSERKGSE